MSLQPDPDTPANEVPEGKKEGADDVPTFQARKGRARASPPPSRDRRESGAPPGSITHFLRAREGIRGDVSLEEEGLPEGTIAGPASEERYSPLGEIARGGMGAIVKIVDNDIRRPVAMKVMLGEEEGDRLERFVEEAQVTGQLEHPNIVPVHELGLDDEGKIYFTMKLVKGKSLESIIGKLAGNDPASARAYPLARLLEVFLSVCDAIAFSHSKGVVHRDLKPENVMVGNFGEVLVMDWGLAKVRGREDTSRDELVASIRSEKEVGQTLDGDVLGTPSYMPPEQANGDVDKIDKRSDIFALGGILYKILTHQAPYSGPSVDAIIPKAVLGKPVPPRKRSPALPIPAELEAICLKAMAFERRERYGSVEAMAEDVRAFLAHRLVKAYRYGLVSRIVRFMQRHPAGSFAGGVALVLVAIGAAVTGVVAGEARAARAREQEEKARAEAESLKRKRVEGEKAEAEAERDTAKDMLEKGRCVSAVLRSAEMELGKVIRELRRHFYGPLSEEEKNRLGDRFWPEVEKFSETVPADSASQATMWVVKGWIRRLARQDDEAFRLFRKAEEIDADIAYPSLFQSMVWLQQYMAWQPLPPLRLGPAGLKIGEVPPETEGMKKSRLEFEKCVEKASRAGVWGESAKKEFLVLLNGFRSHQDRDFAEAEAGLTKGLGIPEMIWLHDEILLSRALVRYYQKKFIPAIEDLSKVLEAQPDTPYLYRHMGQIWLGEAMEKRFRGEDSSESTEKAIRFFDRSLEMEPDSTVGLGNRAMALMRVGEAKCDRGEDGTPQLRRAVRDYTKVLGIDPKALASLSNRAMAYLYLGRQKELRGGDQRELCIKAIADLDAAIEGGTEEMDMVFANRGLAYSNLADARIRAGEDGRADFERAISDCTESLKRNPDQVDANVNLGNAYFGLAMAQRSHGLDPRDLFRKAIRHHNAAFEVNPDLITVYSDRGAAYIGLGISAPKYGEDPLPYLRKGIEDYDVVIRKFPDSFLAYYNRANGYRKLAEAVESARGDPRPFYKKAVADFGKLLALNPDFPVAKKIRAKTLIELGRVNAADGVDPRGDLQQALEDLTDLVEKDTGNAEVYSLRGEVYFKLAESEERRRGDPTAFYEKAIAELREAIRKEPQRYWNHYRLGDCHQSSGVWKSNHGGEAAPHYEKAASAFGETVKRKPDFWQAHANRGVMLENLERYDQAIQAYRAALAIVGDRYPPLKEWIQRATMKQKGGK
ncbi:MAG: protein kinase domain-containing protein [Planctomycetota bacterium]